jgi:hypothetical protein
MTYKLLEIFTYSKDRFLYLDCFRDVMIYWIFNFFSNKTETTALIFLKQIYS